MFAEECRKVAKAFPDVTFEETMVDTMCMKLVMNPQQYDVVVTSNQFGDMITDEGAGLVGGLGLAPGLCAGERQAMAQATHGSAPDIAGRNIANPYAMILSGKMLFEWLGRKRNERRAVDAAKRIDAWMDAAVAGGAKALVRGKRKGNMLPAALLRDVPRDADLYRKEAFGPVACIEAFDAFDAAIDRVNDSDFGLQAGVFTGNLAHAMHAWDRLEVGGVIVGDVPSFRVDNMPYGGVKHSGLGREGVRHAIEDMTEPRLLVIRTP